MVKLLITQISNQENLGGFQSAVKLLSPQPTLIAFHSDLPLVDSKGQIVQGFEYWYGNDFDPVKQAYRRNQEPRWNILRYDDWMSLPPNQVVVWMSVHGLAREEDCSPPIAEDGKLYTLDSYRQNSQAVFELYYLDNTYITWILSNGVSLEPSKEMIIKGIAAFT